MTAHEILVGARNLIDREGWVQHSLHTPGRGYCLLGGLNMAATGSPDGLFNSIAEGGEAYKVLGKQTGSVLWSTWNNAPERTKEEVLAAFDEAIAATAPLPSVDLTELVPA